MLHLEPSQRCGVLNLVEQFSCLFNDVTVVEHDIDVGTARLVKQHPYRVNLIKRELMKKVVDYLLEHGLAEPSNSAWCSPCLLEAKGDGSQRLIIDYRKVNALTVPDSYLLPRMEDCVDSLGSLRFVTKLDLLKGYRQVPLSKRSAKISAFATPDHFLQYTVMAFRMCNAPATFQCLINTVLTGVPNCNAYLMTS